MELPSIAIHGWHNASVAVSFEGDIVSVVEIERFINSKNAGLDYFNPISSKETILKEIYNYFKSEFGFTQYDKCILGHITTDIPQKYVDAFPANEYVHDPRHHTFHALGSLYQSTFDKALIISFDGGSSEGWFDIHIGEKGIGTQKIQSFEIDLGSNYHVIGALCDEIKNYEVLTAAGKVLGLQSYGQVVNEWIQPLKNFFTAPLPYYNNLDGKIESMSNAIGIPFSKTNKLSGQDSYNFARTAQEAFEQVVFEHIDGLVQEHNLPIILTGGCALNIVLNTRVKERYGRKVFVAPNSSDCGLTTGMLCSYFPTDKIVDVTYKGVSVLDKYALAEYVEQRRGIKVDYEQIIEDLFADRILGVVQGNAEHGPRALGNRSIICSPTSPDMKDTLNLKVKHREWFRPFAPIVRLEDVSEYFEWEGESRWMNFCPKVRPEYLDKIPAVVHVDGTARVQTITEEQNPFIYKLLTLFKEKTGIGVLVNTSFNVDRKPILSTYKDAFKVFDETQLDRLYLDGYYFVK
jgi:carbamoyltransferase